MPRQLKRSTGWFRFLQDDRFILGVAGTLIFILWALQVWHLKDAIFPRSDEGVYAMVGMRMFEGLWPSADFGFWHMPLVPGFLGASLYFTGELFLARLLYLTACSVMFVLVIAMILRLTPKSPLRWLGILLTTLWLCTWSEFVHHDMRFVALRGVVDIFFVLFLFLSLREPAKPTSRMLKGIQFILCVLLAFTFAPSLVYVMTFIPLILYRLPKKQRIAELKWYIILFAVVGALVGLYFLIVPNSFQQIVLDQAQRGEISRFTRFRTLYKSLDGLFYVVTGIGMLLALFEKRLRLFAIPCICLTLLSIFLSPAFFPHYINTAIPALALGIFAYVALAETLPKKTGMLLIVPLLIATGWRLYKAPEPLFNEWRVNVNKDYQRMLEVLRRAPEPIFTFSAVLAAEANRDVVRALDAAIMRPPVRVNGARRSEYAKVAAQTCTILVDGQMLRDADKATIEQWKKEYRTVFENRWGRLLLTNRLGCRVMQPE